MKKWLTAGISITRTFAPLRWQGAPTQTDHQYGKEAQRRQRSGAKVLIAFVLTVVPTYQASAWACCDSWGEVGYTAFVQAGNAVASSITAATKSVAAAVQRLHQALNTGFAKLNVWLSKQAAMQRAFKQGGIAANAQLYKQRRAGEAAVRATLPAQLALTVTNAALLSEQSSLARQKIARVQGNFIADFASVKLINSSAIVNRHKLYCSGTDQARGRCETVASPTMQDADLNLNTVINPGSGQYETLSDEERDAGLAFVKNLVYAIPETRPSSQPHSSDQAKAADALLLAEQAALSVAAYSLHSLIAHRTRRYQP